MIDSLGEKPEKELPEKLQTLTTAIEKWKEHQIHTDKSQYPEDYYLEPSPETAEILRELKQLVIVHQITTKDYLEALSHDPDSYASVWIGLSLDVLTDVDLATLEVVANSKQTIPLILLTGRVQEITKGGVNDSQLYNLALRSIDAEDPNGAVALAEACQRFPEVTLDKLITDIENRGLEFPYEDYLKQASGYANHKGQSLTITGRVKGWLLENGSEDLIPTIHNLTNLHPEEIALIYNRVSNIFRYLEEPVDGSILKIVRKKYAQLAIEERESLIGGLLAVGGYESIKNIINAYKTVVIETDILGDLSPRLVREFESHFISHNYTACKKIASCIDALGNDGLSREKLARVDTELAAETNQPQIVERYGVVDVSREAMRYYLSEWVNYYLMSIEYRLENPGKAGDGADASWKEAMEFSRLRDRIEFAGLKEVRAETVRETFSWLQKYLVVAVSSELNHQSLIEGKQPFKELEAIEVFSRPITPEDIRINLRGAEYLFENFEWSSGFGGKRWAEIARLAQTAWSMETEDINRQAWVIDRAFDIQHNSGSIFDKDAEYIKCDRNFRSLLDAKFHAKSAQELLDFGREFGLLAEAKIQTYIDAFKTIERLGSAPTKPKGYE